MKRLLLPLMMLSSSLVDAQRDTAYRLIWYKGTKLNDTTVMTASGRRITYSPRTSSVTVRIPDAKNFFLPVIKGIEQNDERNEEIARIIASHPKRHCGIMVIPVINRVFDRVAEKNADLVKNKIDLPSREEVLSPALTESWKDLPTWVEVAYEEIKEFLVKVKTRSGISDPPPPPDRNLDYCFPCDQDRQQKFRSESDAFIESYLAEEKKYQDKITDILHYFSNRRYKKLPYDTASARIMEPELMSATVDILERIEMKMKVLWFKYNHDVKKLASLFDMIGSTLRSNQLLGRDPAADFPTFVDMQKQAISVALAFIDKALAERDYRVILDFDWIMNLFITAETYNISHTRPLNEMVADIFKNVRFKVKTDGDVAVGGEDDAKIHLKMTGENTFVAFAGTDCRLRWKLLEPDTAKMFHKLEEATMDVQEEDPVYTGTKEWITDPAALKLDFCSEAGRDSAMFYNYFPKDKGKEKWKSSKGEEEAGAIRGIYLGAFIDKKRMEEIANDPAIMEEIQQKMMAKQQEMLAAQKKMNPAAMSAKDLEAMNNMIKAGQEMFNDLPFFHFLLKGHPQNFQKVIFDQTLDGKTLQPDNPSIEHALFKVKIEHIEDN